MGFEAVWLAEYNVQNIMTVVAREIDIDKFAKAVTKFINIHRYDVLGVFEIETVLVG